MYVRYTSLYVCLASSSAANDILDLMGCISHWVKAFLIVVKDFVVFAEGGEQRCRLLVKSLYMVYVIAIRV